ncbi:sensor histidine kinase [Microbacterium album]|uniref:Histidine kinase/HSP90-like ATPase domain-containing protein n=1 Tax=Microbacterium album TaxID=2053191 RepID=A0A917MLC8_9MICO|nr:ATP-binding protein [Microbacterium album]GGH37441.1 hypothetical protein GCM10010921_07300 [Microbacterium album]
MTAQGAIDEAWGTLPPAGLNVASPGQYTAGRMERIIQIVAGTGAAALGTQAFVAALGEVGASVPHIVLATATFASLGAMVVLSLLGRAVRVGAGLFAWVYLVVLLAWPFATAGSIRGPEEQPWTFYLINVASASTLIAFPLRWQIAWAVLMPVLFALGRLIKGGFQAPFWVAVGYDVSVAFILGGVFVTVAWMLRSLATGVDAARDQAVAAYARAGAADAAEKERVAVAALMHDSVLAALIAAERADSPRARQLAVSMAREALTRLANAESDDPEGSDEPVSRAWIADQVESSARGLGVPLEVVRVGADERAVVPGRAARAVVLAATQAIANAVQHAHGEGLRVTVAAAGDGVRVDVSDDGPGLDVAAIPADRLGIRASIIARMTAVGGTAEVGSGSSGTTVTLTWTGEVS